MNVTNLSSKTFTRDKLELLGLVLSFCPSARDFKKGKFADDMFSFIRRMKLAEYFKAQDKPQETPNENDLQDPDWKMHNWNMTNRDWYPDNVRHGRTQALMEFFSNTMDNFRHELKNGNKKPFNNLTTQQRQFLKEIATDKSLTIKPADKGGSVVIMDTKTYEENCLKILNDTQFYTVLAKDPNEKYKEHLQTIVQDLLTKNLITENEADHITQNDRTPTFYCLPKIHKQYTTFPPLRPICSGFNSVTNKLSEWLDGHLYPAAKKSFSYIKDSTDFIKKIQNYKPSEMSDNTYLVTLDVTNLYQNIDHKEGVLAVKQALDKRKSKKAPTLTLCEITRFILERNTMSHQGLFSHQIKGCAMGTNMAVNYANIFMEKFEKEMLQAYEEKYKKSPELWLRFIDDIFFIWKGNAEDLKEFINFCNNYSKSQNYESDIKFTSYISQESVDFLDIKVSISKNKISTELFTKPTAAHLYVHRTSDHPHHIIKSGPKSQFLRIRLLRNRRLRQARSTIFEILYKKRLQR